MRMWMIDPKLLCRKHLLGEHNEIHKHLPSFRRCILLILADAKCRFARYITNLAGLKKKCPHISSEILHKIADAIEHQYD